MSSEYRRRPFCFPVRDRAHGATTLMRSPRPRPHAVPSPRRFAFPTAPARTELTLTRSPCPLPRPHALPLRQICAAPYRANLQQRLAVVRRHVASSSSSSASCRVDVRSRPSLRRGRAAARDNCHRRCEGGLRGSAAVLRHLVDRSPESFGPTACVLQVVHRCAGRDGQHAAALRRADAVLEGGRRGEGRAACTNQSHWLPVAGAAPHTPHKLARRLAPYSTRPRRRRRTQQRRRRCWTRWSSSRASRRRGCP